MRPIEGWVRKIVQMASQSRLGGPDCTKNRTNGLAEKAGRPGLYEKSYKWARREGWADRIVRKIVQMASQRRLGGPDCTKNRTNGLAEPARRIGLYEKWYKWARREGWADRIVRKIVQTASQSRLGGPDCTKNRTNGLAEKAGRTGLYEKSYKWARREGWAARIVRKIVQMASQSRLGGSDCTKYRTNGLAEKAGRPGLYEKSYKWARRESWAARIVRKIVQMGSQRRLGGPDCTKNRTNGLAEKAGRPGLYEKSYK